MVLTPQQRAKAIDCGKSPVANHLSVIASLAPGPTDFHKWLSCCLKKGPTRPRR